MEAHDWTSASGLDVRALVSGLISVARAFEPRTEEEAAVVAMLMIDGRKFLEETEEE
jgi:hypothetical protein